MSETDTLPPSKPFENLISNKGETVDRATDHMPTADWYIAEGIPGVGPRPEWLPEKFPSVKHVVDSYKDLEKTLSTTPKPPEEYDFGEHKETIDIKNPHIQDMIAYAKDKRMSQEVFGKFINNFVEYTKSKQPNIDEEMAKVGPDANQKIKTLETWAANKLSQKSLDALSKMTKILPADMVIFLDEIRQYDHHQSINIPKDDTSDSDFKVITKEDLYNEMAQNREKWDKDPSYRADWRKRAAQVVGEN